MYKDDFNLDEILNDGQDGSDNLFEDGEGSLEDLFSDEPGSVEVKTHSKPLRRFSGWRIFGCIFTGLCSSVLIGLLIYSGYIHYIRFPSSMPVDTNKTGIHCLSEYASSVQRMDSTGEDSYIHQEIAYANGDTYKIDFYKKVLSTIKYTPFSIDDINVYGNPLLNEGLQVVHTESTVGVGDYVIMSCVDYDRIEVDRNVVSVLMDEFELRDGDVDYPNKLVDVFCKYISDLDKLPTKKLIRIPYMSGSFGKYSIDSDEDIYLDRLLFSSSSLYDLMDRFSAVASSVGVANPEWNAWNALSKEEKAVTAEPEKEIQTIEPTEEWSEWNKLSGAEKHEYGDAPDKYSWKDVCSKNWCGTFYLQNEYTVLDEDGNPIKKPISAEIGDGTLSDPAGLYTDVVTGVFVDEVDDKGNHVTNEYPISVRMVEYGVSEDAIKWFESKDVRNRGIDVTSELQYCYYVFEVTNMSDRELTISDNSSLCDKNANTTSRTGTMFGLQDSVTLKPDETGIIESWGRSTELNLRYVIWGADFIRRDDPVWFRVLAGDIDDPSEDKGVTLNKSRNNEE